MTGVANTAMTTTPALVTIDVNSTGSPRPGGAHERAAAPGGRAHAAELLTALMMATTILLATFALLDHVLNRTAETQARVEATQKGRQAMDTMTRAIRSSVCLSATAPAITAAAGTR